MNRSIGHVIVYCRDAPLTYSAMSTLQSPLIRLDRFRRSARLAAFMLAIFVLRIGVVAACAPSDLAEIFQSDRSNVALHSDAQDDSDPNQQDHLEASDGHCLHCSCHHAVALPGSLVPLPAAALISYVQDPPRAQATAPPDLILRPPIV